MATDSDAPTVTPPGVHSWLTGLIAGLVAAGITGILIQFVINPEVLSEGIPSGFGTSGLLAGWVVFLVLGGLLGLVYDGIARIDQLSGSAGRPGTGAYIGAGYGLVLWVIAIIVVPVWVGSGLGDIGTYAVNLRGVLSFVLYGLIIGLVYGSSPATE